MSWLKRLGNLEETVDLMSYGEEIMVRIGGTHLEYNPFTGVMVKVPNRVELDDVILAILDHCGLEVVPKHEEPTTIKKKGKDDANE